MHGPTSPDFNKRPNDVALGNFMSQPLVARKITPSGVWPDKQ
jgi:hypothetical protein